MRLYEVPFGDVVISHEQFVDRKRADEQFLGKASGLFPQKNDDEEKNLNACRCASKKFTQEGNITSITTASHFRGLASG